MFVTQGVLSRNGESARKDALEARDAALPRSSTVTGQGSQVGVIVSRWPRTTPNTQDGGSLIDAVALRQLREHMGGCSQDLFVRSRRQ